MNSSETVSDVLTLALAAERDLRFVESLEYCMRATQLSPAHPDALNLLGRLLANAKDTSHALTLQALVLHLDPEHRRAADDLYYLLAAVRSEGEAQALLEAAIAMEPDIAVHQRHPVSLVPFVAMDRAERLIRAAIECDPSNARAHAALANILSRSKERVSAIVEYGLAVRLRPDFAEAHLALGGLFESVHAESRAADHFAKAVAHQRIYPAPKSATAAARVLVLAVPGGGQKNTPLDFVVNPDHTALHMYYVVPEALAPSSFPEYDVIFNAIDESESSDDARVLVAAFIAAQDKPAINLPNRVPRIRRSILPKTLENVAHCSVPPAARVSRELLEHATDSETAVAGFAFPLLIRPLDTHGGSGLEMVASVPELRDYLALFRHEYFSVSRFVDYRSPDGYYRKYRIVVVDSVPFPYHLAISDKWMVHYGSSLMEGYDWMRAEEERFFRDPLSVFPAWERVFADIAAAIGLDYFAVDCSVLDDGDVLVFECGGAMLVHCQDDPAISPYKYAYVPRIFDAFDALLSRRIGR